MSDESAAPRTLQLLWSTRQPATLRARLGDLSGSPLEGDRVSLPPVELLVVEGDGPVDRLIVGLGTDATGPARPAAEGTSLAALGWATVDAERTAVEFGRGMVGDVADEALLGASARHLETGSGLDLLLLEPSTEGLLAAALARNGEGPVALYVTGRPAVLPAGPASPTALGPGRLAWPSRTGPFVILVEG